MERCGVSLPLGSCRAFGVQSSLSPLQSGFPFIPVQFFSLLPLSPTVKQRAWKAVRFSGKRMNIAWLQTCWGQSALLLLFFPHLTASISPAGSGVRSAGINKILFYCVFSPLILPVSLFGSPFLQMIKKMFLCASDDQRGFIGLHGRQWQTSKQL